MLGSLSVSDPLLRNEAFPLFLSPIACRYPGNQWWNFLQVCSTSSREFQTCCSFLSFLCQGFSSVFFYSLCGLQEHTSVSLLRKNSTFPCPIFLGSKKKPLHAQVYSPSCSTEVSPFLGHAFSLSESRPACFPSRVKLPFSSPGHAISVKLAMLGGNHQAVGSAGC